jgi:hypothetical protein
MKAYSELPRVSGRHRLPPLQVLLRKGHLSVTLCTVQKGGAAGVTVPGRLGNGIREAFPLSAVMACCSGSARTAEPDWSRAQLNAVAEQPAADAMTPMIDPATIASWHALAAQGPRQPNRLEQPAHYHHWHARAAVPI